MAIPLLLAQRLVDKLESYDAAPEERIAALEIAIRLMRLPAIRRESVLVEYDAPSQSPSTLDRALPDHDGLPLSQSHHN